jgi:hypothetical protein
VGCGTFYSRTLQKAPSRQSINTDKKPLMASGDSAEDGGSYGVLDDTLTTTRPIHRKTSGTNEPQNSAYLRGICNSRKLPETLLLGLWL